MSLTHWNYFLALEQDAQHLSRYIEFSKTNFGAYSIETARLLMTATQDVDVLLKQICHSFGDNSTSEGGYRTIIPQKFPALPDVEVMIPRYDLSFVPFVEWKTGLTPSWWTANNKVKHHRNTDFQRASLENMLSSLCGLLVVNLHFYHTTGQLKEIWPGAQMLYPQKLVVSITPTALGTVTNYRI